MRHARIFPQGDPQIFSFLRPPTHEESTIIRNKGHCKRFHAPSKQLQINSQYKQSKADQTLPDTVHFPDGGIPLPLSSHHCIIGTITTTILSQPISLPLPPQHRIPVTLTISEVNINTAITFFFFCLYHHYSYHDHLTGAQLTSQLR